jgi:hypothetical protein
MRWVRVSGVEVRYQARLRPLCFPSTADATNCQHTLMDMDEVDTLLFSRPSSAEPLPPFDTEAFASNLQAALYSCQAQNNRRLQCYGSEAQHSRAGFTPDEVREKYRALQDELKNLDAFPTPSSCGLSDSLNLPRLTAETARSLTPSTAGHGSTSDTQTTDAIAPAKLNCASLQNARHLRTKCSNHQEDITSTISSQKITKRSNGRKFRRIKSQETAKRPLTRAITRASLAKWKKGNTMVYQFAPDYLRNCPTQDLENLRRSSMHGGPDLSDLRGVI